MSEDSLAIHEFELAGLTTRDGDFDRRLPFDVIRVPQVRVAGGRVAWRPGSQVAERRPVKGLLEPFLKLADADAAHIQQYAKEWGPLWLCHHGLPASHSVSGFRAKDVVIDDRLCRIRRDDRGWLWEPISAWREYARWAHGLLTAVIHLRREESAPSDVMEMASHAPAFPVWKSIHIKDAVRTQRERIREYLSVWIEMTAGRLDPVVTDNGFEFRITGGLLSALGFQLAAAIVGTPGWDVCSVCKALYEFSNSRPAPREGERAYCSDHCKREGKRQRIAEASHRYRRKHPERIREYRTKRRSTPSD